MDKDMDKIYSRTRIRIPKVRAIIHNKKNKKLYYFFTMWLITVISIIMTMRFITPPFEAMCLKETKRIGTEILNYESSEILKDVDYNDLVLISKDANEKITMVKSNVILINLLASDIAYNIQKRLSDLEKDSIKIPMGVLTGTSIFAASGPNINVKIIPAGTVQTDFVSVFTEAGINQTIHRLYLDVKCEVSIITPYGRISSEILNQVLFAENIIVGEVPSSFYNLEGLNRNDAMEVID